MCVKEWENASIIWRWLFRCCVYCQTRVKRRSRDSAYDTVDFAGLFGFWSRALIHQPKVTRVVRLAMADLKVLQAVEEALARLVQEAHWEDKV